MGVTLRNAKRELHLPYGSWEFVVETGVFWGWKPHGVLAPIAVVQEPDGSRVPVWAQNTGGRFYPADVRQSVSAADAAALAAALERAEQEAGRPGDSRALLTLRMLGLFEFLREGGFETVPYDYDSPDRYLEEMQHEEPLSPPSAEEAVQRERVRALLQAAFPATRVPIQDERRRRLWLRRKRSENLLALSPEACQEDFPLVLEDLLHHHWEDPGDPRGAESVVKHLNVPGREPASYDPLLAAHLGEDYLQDFRETAAAVAASKAELFALFTPAQAAAIVEWLLLARSWPCLEFHQEDVESAIEYWKRRAGQSDG